MLLVPTMIQMLVDHPALGNHDLSSLKRSCYGASPISEAVLNRAMAGLPERAFHQLYGMTELSPIATLLHWNEHIGEGRDKGPASRRRAAPRSAAKSGSSMPTTGRCRAAWSAKSRRAATT